MAGGVFSVLFNLVSVVLGISTGQNFPPPLPAKEERELFFEMKAGDKRARAKLIEHNLRLVSHIVRKYYASSTCPDELISVGSLGLIKAVDTFHPENGARFATYAAKCVQNEILMYFRSRKKLQNEVSINDTIEVDRDGNPLTYLDVIHTDDTIAEDLDLKIHSERAKDYILNRLDKRERTILILRYGLSGKPPLTQKETAKLLFISRSYVSRIEKKALETLRASFGDDVHSFSDT